MKKGIISAAMVLVLCFASFAFPAYADGCGNWDVTSSTTFCSISYTCMIAGNPNPYMYAVTEGLQRTCVRANNTTYIEYSSRTRQAGGCCRS